MNELLVLLWAWSGTMAGLTVDSLLSKKDSTLVSAGFSFVGAVFAPFFIIAAIALWWKNK